MEKAQPSVDSEEMDQEDNVNHSDDVHDIENEALWDGKEIKRHWSEVSHKNIFGENDEYHLSDCHCWCQCLPH